MTKKNYILIADTIKQLKIKNKDKIIKAFIESLKNNYPNFNQDLFFKYIDKKEDNHE